ncbi:MAG: hypothetical protein ACI9EF_003208, partial [Pseudohongiellaceae bacterium]
MMSTRLTISAVVLLFGLVCAPQPCWAQAADLVPSEKELRAELKKAMKNKDAGVRLEAVVTYAEGTRQLPDDGAAEKLVAKTLTDVLDDDDMGVCNAAMVGLSWGRDVSTVIGACDEALEYVRNIMEKTSTRPDPESRAKYRGALDVYLSTCSTLGNYADDRSVKALETELRALRPGGQLETVSQSLLGAVASALLTLGSEESVEQVIKQTAVYTASTLGGTSENERLQQRLSRMLHDALSTFAVRIERAPPAFTQNYQQDWHAWFKDHRELLEP